jgi:hypothetical protein
MVVYYDYYIEPIIVTNNYFLFREKDTRNQGCWEEITEGNIELLWEQFWLPQCVDFKSPWLTRNRLEIWQLHFISLPRTSVSPTLKYEFVLSYEFHQSYNGSIPPYNYILLQVQERFLVDKKSPNCDMYGMSRICSSGLSFARHSVSPGLRPYEKKTTKWLVISVTWSVPLQVILQPWKCLQFPPKEQPKLTLASHLPNGLWDHERSRHHSSQPPVNLLQGQVQLQDCVHNTQLRSPCPP